MSIKTRMILAFSGIVLLTSLLSLYLSYSTTRRYFIEQTRETLIKLAATMATSLDGDVLRTLTIEDQRSEVYQAEKDKFRRFRRAVPDARIAYFYRGIPDQPGVLDLVMDGLESGEKDVITAQPEDRYYDAVKNTAPRMIEGLEKATADDRIIEDENGVWLSGYAPVYARDGSAAGAVGMDLPARTILQRQSELFGLLLLCSAAAIAVAFIIGLLLARAIAQPVQQLAEATHVIAGGDLQARVKIERHDEIGALGRDFNKMVGNLQAMADALQRYTTEALETHEENMAIQLQRVLLPADELTHDGVMVSASLRPVPWGGGDTYQYFPFGHGAYLMISFGHVRASGLLACSLVTLVQSRLSQLVSDLVLRPAEILTELSRTLVTSAPGLASMDYLCAVYDIGKHWLAIGHAGSLWAFLLRPATLEIQRIESGSAVPLGEGTPEFSDEDIEVQAGDRLVLCSAYCTEVQGPGGDTFGVERLEDTLRRHGRLAAAELRQAVIAEVVTFAAGAERISDDLSILVAELGSGSDEDEAGEERP